MPQAQANTVSLRCGFCLTLNDVSLGGPSAQPSCESCGRPILVDRPVTVLDEDFDQTVLQAGVPFLVDFYAEWCGPCRWVAPIMDEIAQENQGHLMVGKVDTDLAPDVAARFEVRSVPTVVLFKEGVEVERSIGLEPEKLKAMVLQAVGVGSG